MSGIDVAPFDPEYKGSFERLVKGVCGALSYDGCSFSYEIEPGTGAEINHEGRRVGYLRIDRDHPDMAILECEDGLDEGKAEIALIGARLAS